MHPLVQHSALTQCYAHEPLRFFCQATGWGLPRSPIGGRLAADRPKTKLRELVSSAGAIGAIESIKIDY